MQVEEESKVTDEPVMLALCSMTAHNRTNAYTEAMKLLSIDLKRIEALLPTDYKRNAYIIAMLPIQALYEVRKIHLSDIFSKSNVKIIQCHIKNRIEKCRYLAKNPQFYVAKLGPIAFNLAQAIKLSEFDYLSNKMEPQRLIWTTIEKIMSDPQIRNFTSVKTIDINTLHSIVLQNICAKHLVALLDGDVNFILYDKQHSMLDSTKPVLYYLFTPNHK